MDTAVKEIIVLTGAAGFIGAHTVEHILENTGLFIVAMDALKLPGGWFRIEQVLKKKPEWGRRLMLVQANLTIPADATFINSLQMAGKVRYIVNMASDSHVDNSIAEPLQTIQNNVMLTVNMLEFARIIKPDVFLQVSTDEVYGPIGTALVPEIRGYREWERMLPSNPYAASKAAQEMIAISYWRTYGVPLVITNTMNNIGEMQHPEKFLPMLIKKIQAGEQVEIHADKDFKAGSRSYLHARNHADAMLFLLQKPEVSYPFEELLGHLMPPKFHIAGTKTVDNQELAEMVAKILDKPLKAVMTTNQANRPGHDLHYGLLDDRIKELGWVPPISFEEALKRTIQNYLAHPEWLNM
jgi:dTDP-glucose 4,6-dehydratase